MPNTAIINRIQQQFHTWRGDSVKKEYNEFQTALLIYHYVHDTSFDTIRDTLTARKTRPFEALGKYNKRRFGAVLYGALLLEDYCQHATENPALDPQEKSLLLEIAAIFKKLYMVPRKGIATEIQALFDNIQQWVNRFSNNSKESTVIFRGLYTVLKITHITITTLPWVEKRLARAFINVEDTIDGLRQLLTNMVESMNQQDNKAKELVVPTPNPPTPGDNPINQPAEEAQAIDEPEIADVAHFLNKKYYGICQTQQPLAEKITNLSHALQTDCALFTQLTILKKEQKNLEDQLTHALTIVEALRENEQKITGREYVIDLIDDHWESFQSLIHHATATEQDQWKDYLEELHHPVDYQRAINTVAYVSSWVAAPAIALFRQFAPTTMQTYITSQQPITTDAKIKQELAEFAKKYVGDISCQLKKINDEAKTICDNMSHQNTVISNQLLLKTPDELEEISNKNHAINQLMTQYSVLHKQVFSTLQALNKINRTNTEIESFLLIYNNIFIKISNFFAKILPIFKTEAAKQVDEVLGLQQQLEQIKGTYEQTLERDYLTIKDNPNLSIEMQEFFMAQLNINPTSQVTTAPDLAATEQPAPVPTIETTTPAAADSNVTTPSTEIMTQLSNNKENKPTTIVSDHTKAPMPIALSEPSTQEKGSYKTRRTSLFFEIKNQYAGCLFEEYNNTHQPPTMSG